MTAKVKEIIYNYAHVYLKSLIHIFLRNETLETGVIKKRMSL